MLPVLTCLPESSGTQVKFTGRLCTNPYQCTTGLPVISIAKTEVDGFPGSGVLGSCSWAPWSLQGHVLLWSLSLKYQYLGLVLHESGIRGPILWQLHFAGLGAP